MIDIRAVLKKLVHAMMNAAPIVVSEHQITLPGRDGKSSLDDSAHSFMRRKVIDRRTRTRLRLSMKSFDLVPR